MASDDVIPINVHRATLNVTERRGKPHTSVTVTSEPIAVILDDKALIAKIADAMARRIREQTEAIADTVKPQTAEYRRKAEKAFAAGKLWAVKRYSGGRTGVTPPRTGSDRSFNHSGRLASSIVAQWQKAAKAWVINVAANRWNVSDFSSLAQMERAFQEWVQRVPILRGQRDAEVQKAGEATVRNMMVKGAMGESPKAVVARAERKATTEGDLSSLLQASIDRGAR